MDFQGAATEFEEFEKHIKIFSRFPFSQGMFLVVSNVCAKSAALTLELIKIKG